METKYYEKITAYGNLRYYTEFDGKTFSRAVNDKYYCGTYNCKLIRLHHYIWLKYNVEYKEIPKEYCIHHIDHNANNNDINNLKLMTKSEHAIYHNLLRITSIETKNKISKGNTGKPSSRKGVTLSEETKSKIKEARKNQIMVKGAKRSEEIKQKMREAWKIRKLKGDLKCQ
jgi:hypothetical protein